MRQFMDQKDVKQSLENYKQNLIDMELSKATISKYISDVQQLIDYADGKEINKDLTIEYKDHLKNDLERESSTINSKIISINKYLKFTGNDEATLKNIRVQTRELDNVLTQNDYDRMLRRADKKGTDRDVLMLEALYRTGVRVSELQFFTVEALKQGYILADNKGKIRKVPISSTLDKQARRYVKDHDIKSGSIILNKYGDPLSRNYIFKRIKWLAGQARIKKAKAYPHSIRHLFAKQWLERNGDRVTQLADILGHDSLDTTRIYTKQTIEEARETME